ncbi:MAG: STAS domain-containing protein [Leptospirales bacterium]
MLELKTSVQSNIFDIELSGALDSQSAYDFKSWMIQKNLEGYRVISLNCHGLEYISSRGIGSLVDIHRVFHSKQSVLVLYHVSNEVLQLLEFLKLTSEIVILADFKSVSDSYADIAREATPEEPPPAPAQTKVPEEPKDSVSQEKSTPEEQTSAPVDENVEEVIELDIEETPLAVPASSPEPVSTEIVKETVVENTTSAPAAIQDAPVPHAEPAPQAVEEQDEYINLTETASESVQSHPTEFTPMYVYCPNCRQSLRIKKAGQYLCPECRTKFRYPFD